MIIVVIIIIMIRHINLFLFQIYLSQFHVKRLKYMYKIVQTGFNVAFDDILGVPFRGVHVHGVF